MEVPAILVGGAVAGDGVGAVLGVGDVGFARNDRRLVDVGANDGGGRDDNG